MQKKTLWIILGVGGGGLVVCAGCCGVGALIAVPRIREAAERTKSANDLKQVALAMQNYFDANKGRWPARVEELQPMLMGAGDVLQRVQKREIDVVWGAVGRPQPNIIIAWDTKKFGDGRNVAFMDGSVQFMTEAEFSKAPKAPTSK
jgi:prepilin-type processing-associated H-X9-DG protein